MICISIFLLNVNGRDGVVLVGCGGRGGEVNIHGVVSPSVNIVLSL